MSLSSSIIIIIINILTIVIVIDTDIAFITNINITIDYKEYDGDRVVVRVARSLSHRAVLAKRSDGGWRPIIIHNHNSRPVNIVITIFIILQL